MTECGKTVLGCVTGRFQPVHEQHLELFGIALASCEHLIVAVTNPDTDAYHREPESAHRHTTAANPFTYVERAMLLAAALSGRGMADRATIVPFDLTRPRVWAQYVPESARQFVRAYSDWEREKAVRLRAYYEVTLLDGEEAGRVSASDIRAAMRDGADWRGLVPAATVPLLEGLLAARPMRERT
ncbi:MAG TPA: adenylyltransferase/cytidyltransferase family protein [Streptosporangiaceae bacterium]